MADLSQFPDEVRELIQPHEAETDTTLEAIGIAIAQKRDEARTARTASGVEKIWTDAEEAYIGIDDANRGEYKGARWAKPMSSDGPVERDVLPNDADNKSTAFVRMTARYVDAAAGKVGEILLPPDGKPFSFAETPVPELIEAKEDTSQVVHDGLGNIPLTRPAKPDELQPLNVWAAQNRPSMSSALATPPVPGAVPAGTVGTPPAGTGLPEARVPLTVGDFAQENIEIAQKSAQKAEERIYDQMVECRYTAEMRKVIFDSAKLGVGVLKAPFPKAQKGIAVKKNEAGGVDVVVKETIKPAAKHVDPWNIFPDPGCGENIHDGDYIFERDYLSTKQVRCLKKIPGYIADQIDKVLEEKPEKVKASTGGEGGPDEGPDKKQNKDRFEVWYYYGTLTREEMEVIGEASGKKFTFKYDQKEAYAIVTLINRRVVRATFNPLDSGSFPYHSVPWQRRAGHWAGIGVAEQCAMPQRMINAATRAMLDNAGISAGCQIVLDPTLITPADGKWLLYRNKFWYRTGDGAGKPVRDAMEAIEFPNSTSELMSIIEYALKLAEESTSIPLITQGQSGETTPETLGAAQIQNSNANQLLRAIGYAFDDYITEPVVMRWYEWNLLDPDIPDDEKGEFVVNAHGSVALVERAIADQFLWQILPMAVPGNAYALDPKKCAALVVKSKRIDPADVQYSKEEIDAQAKNPPPKDPQVQAAEIRATSDQQIAQMRTQSDQEKTQVQATVDLHKIQSEQAQELENVKAQLAKVSMQLNTQRELSAADRAHDAAMQPPVQLPGRAADGHAFEQTETP